MFCKRFRKYGQATPKGNGEVARDLRQAVKPVKGVALRYNSKPVVLLSFLITKFLTFPFCIANEMFSLVR